MTKTLAPNILITGSNLSGKTTLAKIIVNYALKLGWTPVLCDLNISGNEITPPGCISGAIV